MLISLSVMKQLILSNKTALSIKMKDRLLSDNLPCLIFLPPAKSVILLDNFHPQPLVKWHMQFHAWIQVVKYPDTMILSTGKPVA